MCDHSERAPCGILGEYDYRQASPDLLTQINEKNMQVNLCLGGELKSFTTQAGCYPQITPLPKLQTMKAVYDRVGAVPATEISFASVLKPLIDLDGEMHWKSGVVTVSCNEFVL